MLHLCLTSFHELLTVNFIAFVSNSFSLSLTCLPTHYCRTWSHSVRLIWRRDRLVAETSAGEYKTFTTDRHPYQRPESNPQYQRASGRRPTPSTARPLRSAFRFTVIKIIQLGYFKKCQLLKEDPEPWSDTVNKVGKGEIVWHVQVCKVLILPWKYMDTSECNS